MWMYRCAAGVVGLGARGLGVVCVSTSRGPVVGRRLPPRRASASLLPAAAARPHGRLSISQLLSITRETLPQTTHKHKACVARARKHARAHTPQPQQVTGARVHSTRSSPPHRSPPTNPPDSSRTRRSGSFQLAVQPRGRGGLVHPRVYDALPCAAGLGPATITSSPASILFLYLCPRHRSTSEMVGEASSRGRLPRRATATGRLLHRPPKRPPNRPLYLLLRSLMACEAIAPTWLGLGM